VVVVRIVGLVLIILAAVGAAWIGRYPPSWLVGARRAKYVFADILLLLIGLIMATRE